MYVGYLYHFHHVIFTVDLDLHRYVECIVGSERQFFYHLEGVFKSLVIEADAVLDPVVCVSWILSSV